MRIINAANVRAGDLIEICASVRHPAEVRTVTRVDVIDSGMWPEVFIDTIGQDGTDMPFNCLPTDQIRLVWRQE